MGILGKIYGLVPQVEAWALLAEYADIWPGNLWWIAATEYHINFRPKVSLPHQIPYGQRPEMRCNTQNHTSEKLNSGVMGASNSEWPSLVAFKPRKDLIKLRFCVDYRLLNQVPIPDIYPFPRLYGYLERRGSSEVFTVQHMNFGYCQIPISSLDKKRVP